MVKKRPNHFFVLYCSTDSCYKLWKCIIHQSHLLLSIWGAGVDCRARGTSVDRQSSAFNTRNKTGPCAFNTFPSQSSMPHRETKFKAASRLRWRTARDDSHFVWTLDNQFPKHLHKISRINHHKYTFFFFFLGLNNQTGSLKRSKERNHLEIRRYMAVRLRVRVVRTMGWCQRENERVSGDELVARWVSDKIECSRWKENSKSWECFSLYFHYVTHVKIYPPNNKWRNDIIHNAKQWWFSGP